MLQPGESIFFSESQRFWLNPVLRVLLPLEGLVVSAVIAAVASNAPPSQRGQLLLIGLSAATLPQLLLLLNLRTLVTDRRVIIRFSPFPGRTLDLHDIARAQPITYSPLADTGGWGLKWKRKYGTIYNVAGDRAVHIVTRKGKGLLIGSQRADELAGAMQITPDSA